VTDKLNEIVQYLGLASRAPSPSLLSVFVIVVVVVVAVVPVIVVAVVVVVVVVVVVIVVMVCGRRRVTDDVGIQTNLLGM